MSRNMRKDIRRGARRSPAPVVCLPGVVATGYGLMQLMLPLAWGYMGPDVRRGDMVAALLDPEQNIRFGAAHLGVLIRKELTKHNDAVSLALGLQRGD